MDSFFLNDDFNQQYGAEQRLLNILMMFALLTIFIACLGLSGLAAYSTAQRTKEIGIRKTLGASSSAVVFLLSKDALKPVAVAFVLATVGGFLISTRWMEQFAYHTTLGAGMYVLAGALLVSIAVVTVSLQAIRAAMATPVKSIRYQ